MMKRFALSILSALILMGAMESAKADAVALVALQDQESLSYERAGRIQELFLDGFGFDDVRIVTDLENRDVTKMVKAFLSHDVSPGDRRFVWVSGRYVCPRSRDQIEPLVATLMVAPKCLIDRMTPKGYRHEVSVVPDWDQGVVHPIYAPLNETTFAAVSLPDDRQSFVHVGDMIVERALAKRKGQVISANYLFHALRKGFDEDGSRYVPSLTVSSPKAAWAVNLFGGDRKALPTRPISTQPEDEAQRAFNYSKVYGPLRLYGSADLGQRPRYVFQDGVKLVVLRRDDTGTMNYVRTEDGVFGWVRRDALQ